MASIVQKFKLLQGILSGSKAYIGPSFITLDVTNRCNLRCVGCSYHSIYVKDHEPVSRVVKDIPVALVRELVKELKALGTKSIFLQGAGEPLLHRDIIEIASIIKAAGLHLTIFTNGTLLTSDIIKGFMEADLDCLRVSVWAVSPQQYSQIHPGTRVDYFNRVLDNIRLFTDTKIQMKRRRPIAALHYPISSLNCQSLGDFVELAHQLRCNAVSFSPLNTVRGQLDSFALSPEKEQFVLKKLVEVGRRLDSLSIEHNVDQVILRYSHGEDVDQRTPCYIGWLHVRVRIDGKILPCLYQNEGVGNLNDNSFRQIWNGEAFREFRAKALKHTRRGTMGEICESSYCCHLPDNLRIHRVCKLLPHL